MERKTHRDGWKGEESVKDRITLSKDNIVGFLDGTYTLDMALREAKVPFQPSSALYDSDKHCMQLCDTSSPRSKPSATAWPFMTPTNTACNCVVHTVPAASHQPWPICSHLL